MPEHLPTAIYYLHPFTEQLHNSEKIDKVHPSRYLHPMKAYTYFSHQVNHSVCQIQISRQDIITSNEFPSKNILLLF